MRSRCLAVVLSLVQLERREWAVVCVTEQHEVHVCRVLTNRSSSRPASPNLPSKIFLGRAASKGVVSTPPNTPEEVYPVDSIVFLSRHLDLYLKILIRRALLHLFQKHLAPQMESRRVPGRGNTGRTLDRSIGPLYGIRCSVSGRCCPPRWSRPCRYEPQAALRPRHRHIYQVRVIEEVRWLAVERNRGLLATLWYSRTAPTSSCVEAVSGRSDGHSRVPSASLAIWVIPMSLALKRARSCGRTSSLRILAWALP